MLQYIIPLVASWLPIWHEYLIFYFVGSFVAVFGAIIHSFVRR